MFNSPQFVMLRVHMIYGGLQEQHLTAQHNLEIEIETTKEFSQDQRNITVFAYVCVCEFYLK